MLNFLLGSDVAWSKLVRKEHAGSLMYKECKNKYIFNRKAGYRGKHHMWY
jgi:hypothetical protein